MQLSWNWMVVELLSKKATLCQVSATEQDSPVGISYSAITREISARGRGKGKKKRVPPPTFIFAQAGTRLPFSGTALQGWWKAGCKSEAQIHDSRRTPHSGDGQLPHPFPTGGFLAEAQSAPIPGTMSSRRPPSSRTSCRHPSDSSQVCCCCYCHCDCDTGSWKPRREQRQWRQRGKGPGSGDNEQISFTTTLSLLPSLTAALFPRLLCRLG